MEQLKRLQSIEREMLSEGKSSSEIDAFKAALRRQQNAGTTPQINGVASLSETALNMNRGPRGIAAYMQDGGEAEGYAAEGKKFADDFGPVSNVTAKDAVKFVAEMTPILGDVMAAKDLWAEATSENPNWGYVTALGGATAIGLIPGAGPLLAKGLKAGAKNVFNVGKNISENMPRYDPNVLGSMGGNLFGEGTPDFAAEFLTENLQKKIPEQKIDSIIKGGKADNDSASKINKSVLETANREKIPHPERAFDNPKVEYVDTQTISDLIPRGNMIKYNVGKFQREGGQYYDPMSTDIEEFAKSGNETLRESIYNEGFKEPIVIGVGKETGEVLLNEGHHRLHAALQMGISRVPVVVKIKGRLNLSEFQSPALINTKGLREYKDMSFSELDFESRLKRPKASSERGQDEFGNRTSNYYYMNEPFRQDMPRTDEINFPPMREGYYRKTKDFADGGAVMPELNFLEINKRMQLREEKMIAEGNSASEIDAMKAELRQELYKVEGLPSDIGDFYADGGEVMNGIGSLNETARNMSRGPRGIGAYQQFADGGPVYMAEGGLPMLPQGGAPLASNRRPGDIYLPPDPNSMGGPTSEGRFVGQGQMPLDPQRLQDLNPFSSGIRGDGMSANDLQRMLSRQTIAPENVADTEADILSLQQAEVANRANVPPPPPQPSTGIATAVPSPFGPGSPYGPPPTGPGSPYGLESPYRREDLVQPTRPTSKTYGIGGFKDYGQPMQQQGFGSNKPTANVLF